MYVEPCCCGRLASCLLPCRHKKRRLKKSQQRGDSRRRKKGSAAAEEDDDEAAAAAAAAGEAAAWPGGGSDSEGGEVGAPAGRVGGGEVAGSRRARRGVLGASGSGSSEPSEDEGEEEGEGEGEEDYEARSRAAGMPQIVFRLSAHQAGAPEQPLAGRRRSVKQQQQQGAAGSSGGGAAEGEEGGGATAAAAAGAGGGEGGGGAVPQRHRWTPDEDKQLLRWVLANRVELGTRDTVREGGGCREGFRKLGCKRVLSRGGMLVCTLWWMCGVLA